MMRKIHEWIQENSDKELTQEQVEFIEYYLTLQLNEIIKEVE